MWHWHSIHWRGRKWFFSDASYACSEGHGAMGPVLMVTNISLVKISNNCGCLSLCLWKSIIFPKCWVAWVVCLFHSQLPWLADGFCNHSEVTECFWIVGVSIRCHINHRSLSWGALYFPVLHVDPKKASLSSVGRKDCSFAAMKNTGFWSHKPFHCSS